jgi:hypothetical protein
MGVTTIQTSPIIMKRIIVLTLIFQSLLLNAQRQNFYPNPVDLPLTGFEFLQKDNPYIIGFERDSSNNGWKPEIRYVRTKAPNTQYTGWDQISFWDSGQWANSQSTADSFVLDANNRLLFVFVKANYDYSGFSGVTKEKYQFFYNSLNQINRIDYSRANPDTSNNYVKQSITYRIFDSNGKQVRDSTVYYYSSISIYLNHYHYDGDNLVEIDQLTSDGDTTAKTIYTYDGNKIATTANLSFDVGSDEWTATYADTFIYNTLNQVSRRISAGYVYIDGNLYFKPYRNDSYTYNSAGQLKEMIIRSWEVDQWFDRSITKISYSANGKAEEGYQYAVENGDWSPTPYFKYIFDFATGIPQIQKSPFKASIYPNPASNYLMVESTNEKTQLSLFDLSGKNCLNQTIFGDQKINLDNLNSGVYFLILSNGHEQYKQKIIIQH